LIRSATERNILMALFWKEWRENSPVLFLGGLWMILLFGSIWPLGVEYLPPPPETVTRVEALRRGLTPSELADSRSVRLRRAALRWVLGASAAMVFGVAAMTAAGSFAQERESRNELYLESLAVDRRTIWLAKALARGIVVLFSYLCVFVPILALGLEKAVNWEFFGEAVFYVLLFSIFGVVFLSSTLLSNSMESLAAGLVFWLLPCFIMTQIYGEDTWHDALRWPSALAIYGVWGGAALAFSAWIYVRRPWSPRG